MQAEAPISRDTSAWAHTQPTALASWLPLKCRARRYSHIASRRSQPAPVHSSPNPSPVPHVGSLPDAAYLLSA